MLESISIRVFQRKLHFKLYFCKNVTKFRRFPGNNQELFGEVFRRDFLIRGCKAKMQKLNFIGRGGVAGVLDIQFFFIIKEN